MDLKLSKINNFFIVRDDLLIGGTKSRIMKDYLNYFNNIEGFIYCSSPFGYAQIALANATDKKVHIFIPKRKILSSQCNQIAHKKNVVFHPIFPGYMSVLKKRAQEFQNNSNNNLLILPFGLKDDLFTDLLKNCFIKLLKPKLNVLPDNIWMVWGSGNMIISLDNALNDLNNLHTNIIAVQIGAKIDKKLIPKRVKKIYVSSLPFSKPVKNNNKPPYPSNDYYDAKIWEFVLKYGKKNDWVWNVAA